MSDNPYQTTQPSFSPPSLANNRPASVTIFGILNIAFALLGLCGLAGSIAMFFIPVDPDMSNPAIEMMQGNTAYRAFMIVSIPLGFIATIVLAIGGVGLLTWRKYGRTASIYYGWYTIVSMIIGTVVNWVFLFAPMLQQAQQANGPEQAGAIGGIIGGSVGGCFGIIYPVLLLYFMSRSDVKNSLS